MKIGKDVGKAAEILRNGGLVAIPTETVYGLAANAINPKAVAKIFEAKKRPSFDPLIIHLYDAERVVDFAFFEDENAKKLADAFWPGPLTMVLPKREIIPGITSSGLDTVGVRLPKHPLTRELLKILDFPLAAPSANLFGYVSPTTAQHVYDQLGEEVDYILDGGRSEVGLESTIIGFEDKQPTVFRRGGIPIDDIEEITGKVRVREHSTSNPQAPGMLSNHYSPHKILVPGPYKEVKRKFPEQTVGVLLFGDVDTDCPAEFELNLSQSGDLNEAAYHLFDMLRQMDKMKPEVFAFQFVPDTGLGQAINDRLKRAAVK